MTVKTAANTPDRLVAPSEFDRLVAAIERCASALETLASDVKPPNGGHLATFVRSMEEAQAADPLVRAMIHGDDKVRMAFVPQAASTPLITPEIGKAISDQLRQEAPMGQGAPAATWSDEAKRLESELVAQEDAKAVLGPALHGAIWGVAHNERASVEVAVLVKREAVRILGGESAFAQARTAVGVESGALPTGDQMRSLAAKFLVPKARQATSESEERGDAWEG